MEDVVHCGSGTYSHADSIRSDLKSGFLAALLGNDLSCGRISCVGHVAVHSGCRIICKILKSVENFLRGLQVRVADREVVYVFSSVDGLKSSAFFEHLTDLRTALEGFDHFLGNHSSTSNSKIIGINIAQISDKSERRIRDQISSGSFLVISMS